MPCKEGPGSAASPLTRKDSPELPTYYGVCSFCGLVGHGHELCPELKRAVREQADQIARIQMAKYEEVRNRAQEPNSRTKKLVRNIQDKAEVAKENQQDSRHLPAYSTGGGGPGPDRDGDGDPTDQDRDSSSEPGGNGFPFGKRRGGGGPPEDPDPEDDDGIPRGFRGR